MEHLSLPAYTFRFRESEKGRMIYDRFRKKYILLTPEEWVRQNLLVWLTVDKGVPVTLIAVEMTLHHKGFRRRCDAVVFSRNGEPLMIIECKAPEVAISQDTFDQIARYNYQLLAPYLLVTNGMDHFCCRMDYKNHAYHFLSGVPHWEEIIQNVPD